jgi:hypothetical protein
MVFCFVQNFFLQNLTLGYMAKTLNQIIFFFLHQNQNIFFSNIGNQNIFCDCESDFPDGQIIITSTCMCFYYGLSPHTQIENNNMKE